MNIPPEANLSPCTENFILSLCCGAEDRLGRLSGAEEIKMHPYFEVWIRLITLKSGRRAPARGVQCEASTMGVPIN